MSAVVVVRTQAWPGATVEVFSPRGLADGHQLAHLGSSQRQRHPADDSETRSARSSARSTLSPPASAAQRRLSSGKKHHPDHRHRLLLRQYFPSFLSSSSCRSGLNLASGSPVHLRFSEPLAKKHQNHQIYASKSAYSLSPSMGVDPQIKLRTAIDQVEEEKSKIIFIKHMNVRSNFEFISAFDDVRLK